LTVDTNVLARAVLRDDPRQARVASAVLRGAELIAVPLPCLCELAWILRRGAGLPREDVSRAVRALINASNVIANRAAVEAGLDLLDAGGDFADGVIAHEGAWLGGETFASFDKDAVKLLAAQGHATSLLT
jgi:predicted nucleic-acid-binding protein